MTVEAGMKINVGGSEEASAGLDNLKDKLRGVGEAATTTSARIKGYQALWKDPVGAKGKWDWTERMGASIAKASTEIITRQIGAAADAVMAPAKTTYAGAIAVANNYRDTTQRIATSTGRSYYEISAQIDTSAKRLGLMPERVQAYGRGVRSMTDDWGGAVRGLDAYQSRALKTDRTLEEMIPTAIELTNSFGLSKSDQVARFFGTIDKQAAAASVSAQKAERVFFGLSETFAQLSSADTSKLSAISTTFLAGANGNMGRAERRASGAMGFLDQHGWWFEQQARRQGVLGKKESFFDNQGLIKDPLRMIEFAQKEVRRVSKGKVTGDDVNYLTAIEGMPRETAAGLMNFDVKAARARERDTGAAADATAGYLGTDAGKRTQADASKVLKDIGLGNSMLPAQDAAVAMGGGAAGVAMGAAGELFGKATGVFSDAVALFAKSTASGGVGSGIAAAAGAAGRTILDTGTRAVAGLSGVAGLAAGALFLEGDKVEAPRTAEEREKSLNDELEARKNRGAIGQWFAKNVGSERSAESIQKQLLELRNGSGGMSIDATSADLMGASIAKHLQSTTLRTQSVQPMSSGPGQEQPL